MRDLPELMLSYGIKLKERGNRYECLCPAHDDHNPSMSVFRNGDGNWKAHCFSCGFHEDEIGLVQYMESCDYARAKEIIGDPMHKGKRYATIEAEKLPPRPQRETYPPPPDAPAPAWERAMYKNDADEWVSLGQPVKVWAFKTLDGALSYYEARYEANGKKEPRCWSWGHRGAMPPRWECAAPEKPRPLYGLDNLATARQIIILEGPKAAEAAQNLIGNAVACLAWPCGANGFIYADWGPVIDSDLPVVLFPDADDHGRRVMLGHWDKQGKFREGVYHLINKKGRDIKIINTDGMPDGWDVADGIAEGWTLESLLEWIKPRKEAYNAPSMPEQIAVKESEPPNDPSPPIDAYEEVGIVWQEPGDIFHEVGAPPYRDDIIPACFHDWIHDTAGVKGVDPAILAISSIVAAATCLHDDIKLQPEHNNPGWKESARIWGAVVGSSGIKKSPAIAASISRIKKIQLDLSANAVGLEAEYKAKESLYETQQKDYVKALAAGDTKAIKPARPDYPEIPRIYFEDVTIEKLSDSLKASRRGCMVLRDELAGFFAFNQYKGGQGGDAAAWLEFYEGGPRYTDRVNRGSTFTPNWGGCVLGGIQPSAMQKIVDSLPEDGMLQRFIVINAKPGREGNERPYNKAANDRYHNILQQIYDTVPSIEIVMLSPEANEIRKEVTREAFRLIRAGLISSGLCSHLAKYEGLFARLALTYHAIECADKHIHPQSCKVSGDTAAMVSRLMLKYLLPHAVTFYLNLSAQSQIGHGIRKVGELCLIHNGEIANRDIQRGWIGWRCFKPYDQEIVIQTLVDQGWILPHPNARLSTSGRPTRYLINPRLQAIHSDKKIEEMERRKIAVDLINQCKSEANWERSGE